MTVQQDLQKAVASAKSVLGNYEMFVQSTQDQSAKQMFQDMARDMSRHVDVLNARLSYLNANNQLNQQAQQQQG